MNTKDEALKLALEALRDIIEGSRLDDVGNRNDDGLTDHDGRHDFKKRIANAYEALQVGEQALAQPEQEPVAWMRPSKEGYDSAFRDAGVVAMSKASGATHWDNNGWVPLYTSPPAQREWVGLTKMELIKCGVFPWGMSYRLYEAIEAKLKEKNT